ncbi:hypothetical protein TBR22_A32590 [Luteitalea sp. TBR-22]|uniref:3-keto-disaccharide hydrolase n=1 Tax=Luteitalea sp. TBR-22 TaxID=2802971 RepID=UPI001AF90DDA|nr:DUF1080 domain-containing protein [Luteitalea sp. TBR-22]BCS34030.1 hypothetical protein TBR22_A32590 [Luteitalea sp. TBR-22]
MRSVVLALALTLSAHVTHAEERPLFNGRDLTGWTHVGAGQVVVENGLLKTVGGMGLLYYAGEKFGDCVIRVVYRTTTVDDNSGIFVRIPEPPKDAWQAVHTGYEIQILENFPSNYVLSEHQKKFGTSWHTTGAIYSMSPALAKPQKPVGEWNTMEIELRGPRTMVRLNGVLVNDFVEGSTVPPREHSYEPVRGRRPDVGYIGIQNHHEPQTVLFREITVIR